MFKIIVFILASLVIISYSWNSLKSSRSHCFFRFFAFDYILILVLLNVDYWFNHPFSIRQIISWLLLASSIFLAVYGFHLLRIVGKQRENFEDTTTLVQIGVYKYIRHPLYIPAGRSLGSFS